MRLETELLTPPFGVITPVAVSEIASAVMPMKSAESVSLKAFWKTAEVPRLELPASL